MHQPDQRASPRQIARWQQFQGACSATRGWRCRCWASVHPPWAVSLRWGRTPQSCCFQPGGSTGPLIGAECHACLVNLQEINEADGIASVHEAFRLGINFFDTSPFYGTTKSEQVRRVGMRCSPAAGAVQLWPTHITACCGPINKTRSMAAFRSCPAHRYPGMIPVSTWDDSSCARCVDAAVSATGAG